MLDIYISSRELWSQNNYLTLAVQCSRTMTYRDCAFVTAAPKQWNALPKTLKSCENLPVFKRALKLTYLKGFIWTDYFSTSFAFKTFLSLKWIVYVHCM